MRTVRALVALVLASLPAAVHAQTCCATIVPIAVHPGPGSPAFEVGCTEYVLQYGGGTGAQGSYGAIDLSSFAGEACGGGSSGYVCEWQLGVTASVDSGTCIPRLAGNMSGPTASAIESRFSQDTDQRQGVCYGPDCPTSLEYHGNGRRIVVAPITSTGEPCGYRVEHFGRFFLTRIPGLGDRNLVYCTFLGFASSPTAVARPTWGAVKQVYR